MLKINVSFEEKMSCSNITIEVLFCSFVLKKETIRYNRGRTVFATKEDLKRK